MLIGDIYIYVSQNEKEIYVLVSRLGHLIYSVNFGVLGMSHATSSTPFEGVIWVRWIHGLISVLGFNVMFIILTHFFDTKYESVSKSD